MASTGCWSLASETIDARGLKCPLPVLKLEKRLQALPAGAELTVLATDPMAKIDIPLYCRQNGHACVLHIDPEAMHFEIVKAG